MGRGQQIRRADRSFAALGIMAGLGIAVGIVAAKGAQTSGLLDLRIYRNAAAGIAHGELYDYQDPAFGLGFTYPPFAALAFVVLRVVPIRLLEFTWTLTGAIGWLALLTCFWNRAIRDRAPAWARAFPCSCVVGVWLISLLGAPMWLALNQGQVGILLWCALGADVVLTVDDRRAGGFLTGFAAATKMLPLAAIPLYVIAGRIGVAKRAVLTFAGLTLLGWVMLPSESHRYWGELLWSTRVGETSDPRNDSVLGLLSRLLGGGWPATASWLVACAGVLALGAMSFHVAVARRAPLSATLFLGATMSLLAPITWTHHLVFLSLLLFVPLLSWDARPVASGLGFAVITLLLVDPIGAGNADDALGSATRAAMMVAILLWHRGLVDLEQPEASIAPALTPFDSSAIGDSSPGLR